MSITRREFINTTALAGVGALAGPFKTLANPIANAKSVAGFELLILATNWGFSGSLDDFCTRIKKEGYDGAELWCPTEQEDRNKLVAAFAKHNLKFGLLAGGSDADPEKHFQQFKSNVEQAVALKPLYINCHSGRDFFSFEQNKKFIDLTTQFNRSSGVPIYHETHRSRILYSAPIARQFIEKIPELRLTLDISHWCNVHE